MPEEVYVQSYQIVSEVNLRLKDMETLTDDPQYKRLAKATVLYYTGFWWSQNSKWVLTEDDFFKQEGWDLVGLTRELFGAYNAHTDRAFFKSKGIGFDVMLSCATAIPMLLTYNATEAFGFIDRMVSAFEGLITAFERGDSQDLSSLELFVTVFMSVVPLYGTLGLWDRFASILKSFRLEQLDSPMFDTIWNPNDALGQKMFGGKLLHSTIVNLWIFLVNGRSVGDPETIRASLQPPQALVELTMVHIYYGTPATLLLPAALASEKIGDDEMAEFFALKGEEFHMQWHLKAMCRAVRARILSRKGDRAGAVQIYESAASDVFDRSLPLVAIRLGQDCGGEEGDRMFNQSLAMMGAERAEFEDLSGLAAPQL